MPRRMMATPIEQFSGIVQSFTKSSFTSKFEVFCLFGRFFFPSKPSDDLT